MKYIFLVGAPGSKWSSVCKNIYYSPSIDRSDYSDARTYYHSAWGQPELMHLGAYFDPGMEFGNNFDKLSLIGKHAAELEFDRPFNGTGVRIIKSHVFAYHLEYIKQTWGDCPIVLVHRPNDACLGWWVRCREFRITYPNYQWYENLDNMAKEIDKQNKCILDFANNNYLNFNITNNIELCDILGIEQPAELYQNYVESDTKVAVLPT
jgi:hypothetical protein